MKALRAFMVAMTFASIGAVGLAPEAASAAAKPLVSISPAHIQSPDGTAATMWINNRTGRKLTMNYSLGYETPRTKRVPTKLSRISMPSMDRRDADVHLKVWTVYKGKTYKWEGFLRRPKPDIANAAEKKRSGKKVIELRLDSSRPITLVTNSVIYSSDGRSAKCYYNKFTGSAYIKFCEVTVDGDFAPKYVEQKIFRLKSGGIEIYVDYVGAA